MLKIIFAQSMSQNNFRPKKKKGGGGIIITFYFFHFLVKNICPFPHPCSRCRYLKSSKWENTVLLLIWAAQIKDRDSSALFASLSVLQVHLKNAAKNSALSEKVSMDLAWPFLFSSLAKAQIPKKILLFSQLKVFLCCLHSVNLNRRGLECETACV